MATTRPIIADRENAPTSTVPAAVVPSAAPAPAGPAGDGVACERSEYWLASRRPFTRFDHYLVEQVAVSAVRIDRCRVHEQSLRERAAARAAACWDEDRALAAEKTARGLPADPAVVRLQLRQSPQGCRWLVARWLMLVEVFMGAGAWTDAQKSLALDLLGVGADLRGPGSPLDAPGAGPMSLARCELDSLQRTAAAVAPLDAEDRRLAELGTPVEPDRLTALARRYEAAAMRQMRWALKELKVPRPVPAERGAGAGPERPPAAPAAAPGPPRAVDPRPAPLVVASATAGAERSRWGSKKDRRKGSSTKHAPAPRRGGDSPRPRS